MTTCCIDECERPRKMTNGMCSMHYQRWKRIGTAQLPAREYPEFCTVDSCERKASRKGAGMCEPHYYQVRRNGEITSATILTRTPAGQKPPKQTKVRTVKVVLPCKEGGCEKPAKTLGWCAMHHTRWTRHGDVNYVGKAVPLAGPSNPLWRGGDVAYGTAHQRVYRRRGSARSHACDRCGEQAAQWAYDHTDPDEKVDPKCGPYSADPSRYMPLCVSCHKKFDLARIAAAAA